MELLSALLGLEQMEPFCSLPTGHFLLLPQRSIVALHRAASSRSCLSSRSGFWSQIRVSPRSRVWPM